MRILIIGSGGREHAVVWALQRTSQVPVRVFCAPGNAGIQQNAETRGIPVDDLDQLVSLAREERIDLTFVGPEAPLAAGIVDKFTEANLVIVGPSSAAAQLESSKVFAKRFMARHSVPTAAFEVAESTDEAVRALQSGVFGLVDSRVVIKADGLAAGKGVVVADSHAEAKQAIEDLMVKQVVGKFAAQRIVIEEALEGQELSVLLFTDGDSYALMPPARDHKRIGENDTGPNTGGMGSITDSSLVEPSLLDVIAKTIVEPTLAGARAEGFPFKGILFLGLMLTPDGPKLLEYNVRFGDPETQAILIRLRTDLLSIFQAIDQGTLSGINVEWESGSSACVVLASGGYPGKYTTGHVIQGLEHVPDNRIQIFHAGTARSQEGKFITSGGRVLGVTAVSDTLPNALALCYEAIGGIDWAGMQFRRDIGASILKQNHAGK